MLVSLRNAIKNPTVTDGISNMTLSSLALDANVLPNGEKFPEKINKEECFEKNHLEGFKILILRFDC